jgi:hypothetical protein
MFGCSEPGMPAPGVPVDGVQGRVVSLTCSRCGFPVLSFFLFFFLPR